jgi:hypothetical protein
MEDPPKRPDDDQSDAAKVPPETSDHPSHEEEVGGQGAEDPAEMADEDRYRKGPGW